MSAETSSAYWETLLGNSTARLPVYENDPQPGRYRARSGERYVAVAIWREAGVTRILRDGQLLPPEEHARAWTWCAKNPITPQAYEALLAGAPQGDPIYSALPDAPADLLARLRALGAIPSAADTPEDAERLADAAHLLKTIEKRAIEKCNEIAAPLNREISEKCAPWNEVKCTAVTVRDPIMAGLARFLAAKNAPGGIKGQLGKAISLRTDKALEIADYDAALAHFAANEPEAFRSVVEKLARAALKDGRQAPGCRMREERRAQ